MLAPPRLTSAALARQAFLPMFVSLPQYQFDHPAEIAPPGAQYWRSLGPSVNAAWFLLTVRLRTPERLHESSSSHGTPTWSMHSQQGILGLLFAQARLIVCQELIARFGAAAPSPP